eukprot:1091023-Rhodomonas_salina.1
MRGKGCDARQHESLGELEMVCAVVGWMGLEVGECCRRVALRSGRRHPPTERWLLQLEGRPLREAPSRLSAPSRSAPLSPSLSMPSFPRGYGTQAAGSLPAVAGFYNQ